MAKIIQSTYTVIHLWYGISANSTFDMEYTKPILSKFATKMQQTPFITSSNKPFIAKKDPNLVNPNQILIFYDIVARKWQHNVRLWSKAKFLQKRSCLFFFSRKDRIKAQQI